MHLFGAGLLQDCVQLGNHRNMDMAKQREIESTRLRRRRGRAASMMSTPDSRQAGGVATTKLLGG